MLNIKDFEKKLMIGVNKELRTTILCLVTGKSYKIIREGLYNGLVQV